jgi:hypothetical protein
MELAAIFTGSAKEEKLQVRVVNTTPSHMEQIAVVCRIRSRNVQESTDLTLMEMTPLHHLFLAKIIVRNRGL